MKLIISKTAGGQHRCEPPTSGADVSRQLDNFQSLRELCSTYYRIAKAVDFVPLSI